MENSSINPVKSIKYLGFWLNDKLSFKKYVEKTAEKAAKDVSNRQKIMPNVKGLSYGKRRLLNGVVKSTILYGSSIWISSLILAKYRDLLEKVQRKMLLRTRSAFKTTSTKALQVIAGELPIYLLVRERALNWKHREEDPLSRIVRIRAQMIQEWQEEWSQETRIAQWTKRLIPNLEIWIACKHRTTNYYLA